MFGHLARTAQALNNFKIKSAKPSDIVSALASSRLPDRIDPQTLERGPAGPTITTGFAEFKSPTWIWSVFLLTR